MDSQARRAGEHPVNELESVLEEMKEYQASLKVFLNEVGNHKAN
jgi:hypothetical protein